MARAAGIALALGLLCLLAVHALGSPARHRAKPDSIALFLLCVAAILALCHLLGALARRLHQPAVLGEIVGGLLLGPSALGAVWPAARTWLFSGTALAALQAAAQLGLAAFMFLVGAQLRSSEATATGVRGRAAAYVTIGGMAPAFLGGAVLAVPARHVIGGGASPVVFAAFLGLAMSITALPVLARMVLDLRLAGTPDGRLALASAAVGDGVAWGVLTVLLALPGHGGLAGLIVRVGVLAALGLLAVLGLQPALAALGARRSARSDPGPLLLPLLVAGAVGFAAVTSLAGLHPAVGAFLFGLIVPRRLTVHARLDEHVRGFTVIVLLPLFFAGIGLSTSVGLLGTAPANWLVLGGVLLVAIVSKVAGAGAGAWLAGVPGPAALRLGALMCCRGVTELVVASIGWQHHFINALGLTTLVLMALITTALAGPAVRLLSRRVQPE